MPFDANELMPVLTLPEGNKRPGVFKAAFGVGEKRYDSLWKYISKVDKKIYKRSDPTGSVSKSGIALMENGVPAFADFKQDILFLGRKLTIPFSEVTGLVATQGLLPGGDTSTICLLIGVNGCDDYIPLHRFENNNLVRLLVTKLKLEIRAPLGLFSKALGIALKPGTKYLIHSNDRIPLRNIKGILTSRSGNHTSVNLLHEAGRMKLVASDDPDGALEHLGTLMDELLALNTRGTRPDWS